MYHVTPIDIWGFRQRHDDGPLLAHGERAPMDDSGRADPDVPSEADLDVPFAVERHDALASTNDRARDLAARGETDVAVVADEQTGGRGRRSRGWASPPGGVWASVLLRPEVGAERAPLLTLAAAVATTRACREAGADAGIKWPNDVLCRDGRGERGGSKVAGVLTERGVSEGDPWLVVGVGVNANVDADALPAGATSLREAVGDVDRDRLLARLLRAFDDLRRDLDGVVGAWREHALTLGRRVRVETAEGAVVGDAVDVTADGALVVSADGGEREIRAGDCEHLRPV
jgi:BirA family biotin operon repressor/biotin-[acetyl-CoA-carboxylase] ligase